MWDKFRELYPEWADRLSFLDMDFQMRGHQNTDEIIKDLLDKTEPEKKGILTHTHMHPDHDKHCIVLEEFAAFLKEHRDDIERLFE